MLLKIKVTVEHIKNGKSCRTRLCPIAIALMEVIDDLSYYVEVWAHDIYVYHIDSNYPDYGIKTPKKAARFIDMYDVEPEDAQPFEFEIEIPEKYLIKVESINNV